MDCIDPTGPKVFRGDDIVVPETAGLFRCPSCERERTHGRNTILFRGILKAGTALEILCRRCKALVKFQAGEQTAA